MITLYHNQSCSKSMCAFTVLEESGLPFQVINYLETPPSLPELREIVQKLNIEPGELVRKNEPVYTSLYEGKTLTAEEWLAAMVEHPILIERPIIVSGNKAVIARPVERLSELLQTLAR